VGKIIYLFTSHDKAVVFFQTKMLNKMNFKRVNFVKVSHYYVQHINFDHAKIINLVEETIINKTKKNNNRIKYYKICLNRLFIQQNNKKKLKIKKHLETNLKSIFKKEKNKI